ncbi:MAG: hypothetical protein HKP58_00990 [Desulfatitalea sp.]|nr:hypothetical protein [Desulfatitalea sp.]NNJ98961.1 hypothetical protein [Desulfatitalea sp.]
MRYVSQNISWHGVAAVAAWVLVFCGPLDARQCLSPSPTLQKGEDPYGPIASRELTPSEHEQLVRLFKSLAGDWAGAAASFFCASAWNPDDVEHRRETIKARVQVDRGGNLQMAAELYSERERSSHQKHLRFYLNPNQLRLNNDNGTGDVELIEVADTRIAFLYRRMLPGAGGSSIRQEYFFTLEKDADGFRIEEMLFVQGKLSSGYTWQFK